MVPARIPQVRDHPSSPHGNEILESTVQLDSLMLSALRHFSSRKRISPYGLREPGNLPRISEP